MWPLLVQSEGYEVGTYGALVAIAFLSGLWLAQHLGARDGLERGRVYDVGIRTLLSGFVTAMILGWLVSWASGSSFEWQGYRNAGPIHGALLGALVAGPLWARHYGLDVRELLDAFVPAIPWGQAIGRLGCFATGCCYGSLSDLPWAVTFVRARAMELGGVPLHVSRHPVQLYDAFLHFGLFALFLMLHKRSLLRGRLIGLWCVLEGCTRWFIESFRGDFDRGIWFDVSWLSTGRLTAGLLVLFGGVLFARDMKKHSPLK